MLVAEREARGLKNVAISCLEQISPFPYDMVRGPCMMVAPTHRFTHFAGDSSP